jgi:translation initiation factor IF-3
LSSFRSKKRKNKQPRKFYKINHYITAPQVRLLDEQGKQIGVISINEARQQARENELDLVEINGKAQPPVVKMISFSKFRYQESKKLKAEKRGIKGGTLKEVQMSPFIGENDYQIRINRSKKFLTTGNKVKLSIKFQGRQVVHKEFGHDLAKRFTSDLQDHGTPEGEAKLIGKRLFMTFTPSKQKVKDSNEKTK